MKRYFILLSCTILILGCKEYFPNEDSYRDPELFGTWIRLHQMSAEYPSLEVYTSEGYGGGTIGYSNNQTNNELAFQGLGGIWFVQEANSSNNLQYNLIHSKGRFRNGKWNITQEYRFQSDTLFLRDWRYDWDTLIKYELQLNYDGPNYVSYDSLK